MPPVLPNATPLCIPRYRLPRLVMLRRLPASMSRSRPAASAWNPFTRGVAVVPTPSLEYDGTDFPGCCALGWADTARSTSSATDAACSNSSSRPCWSYGRCWSACAVASRPLYTIQQYPQDTINHLHQHMPQPQPISQSSVPPASRHTYLSPPPWWIRASSSSSWWIRDFNSALN